MKTQPHLQNLETPCFIFDETELRKNFSDFSKALHCHWSPESLVAYSVKTNSLPWVLECARDEGCFAEVVSDDEFALALSCGYRPDQIVFNGPVKGNAWFNFALEQGSLVNIDSEREIRWAKEYACSSGRAPRLGVRVNIDLERACPGETLTGERGGRFGFSYEAGEVARVVGELRDAGCDVVGLHMHVTTLSRSREVYRVLARHAARIVDELALELDYLDIGGGFYGGGQHNSGAYDGYVAAIAESVKESINTNTTRLIVEPGGAVICTPGSYVGRVIDVKDTPVDRFVTSDISRINIDHEMKKDAYSLTLETAACTCLPRQVLCGYTCMESDRLCLLENEPELAEGDFIIINNAGAYSTTFTPELFIWHPPAVYVKKSDGSYSVIRPLVTPRVPPLFEQEESPVLPRTIV